MKKGISILVAAALLFSGCGAGKNVSTEGKVGEEEALSAIRNYCYAANPELEQMVKDGEYPIDWEIASSDDEEIVVLYRSYTGAEVRYYIDRDSGETYVTEFVSGITPEEEKTDEEFNVRDY